MNDLAELARDIRHEIANEITSEGFGWNGTMDRLIDAPIQRMIAPLLAQLAAAQSALDAIIRIAEQGDVNIQPLLTPILDAARAGRVGEKEE